MARDGSGRFARKGSQAAAIGASLKREVEKAAVALTLEIAANLRAAPADGGTPVDTGNARAHWIPSIGTPALALVSGDTGYGPAAAGLLKFRLEDGALWVSNAVNYIGYLNLHPRSFGFVEVAMAKAEATIQQRYDSFRIELGPSAFTQTAGGYGANNLASAYSPFGGDDD